MKILIMGAGAIGCYFGARLQQAGCEVVYCARGEGLRALRDGGLRGDSIRGDFALRVSATDRPANFAPYDLILFCVKSYDTDSAADQLAGCLAPDGAILTIQNGVENESRLRARFGAGAVMSGNARIGAAIVSPGHIRHSAAGYIEFGEIDGGLTPRGQTIAALFERADILGRLADDIRPLRWEKLLWNAAFNTICSLGRCTVGRVLADPDSRALARQVMDEVRMVAAAQEGIVLGADKTDAAIALSEQHFMDNRPSTLQDLERGRRLEVEALIGVVARLARRNNLQAPASSAIYALMKLIDPAAAAA